MTEVIVFKVDNEIKPGHCIVMNYDKLIYSGPLPDAPQINKDYQVSLCENDLRLMQVLGRNWKEYV